MTPVATIPVYVDERGVAWVGDTNTKVKEIVLDQMAHGWSPEEMHEQHPHLSLAHIHAALSYYHDHKEEIDAGIERDVRAIEALRAETKPFSSRSAW